MRGPLLSTRVSVALALLSCTAIASLHDRPARAAVVEPVFSAADFSPGAPIDNPYFPLVPGPRFTYAGTTTDADTGETAHEVEEDSVTNQTIDIAGVKARVVHNTVTEDGEQVEDTKDYYAQDKSGNVWYLGEDTAEFQRDDNGNIISTDTSGSWRTGVHGAQPGFIMPANPTVGFAYAQENAPQDEAIDQAQVLSLNETLTVPFGTFDNVLKTLETSPLEPGVMENKLYAKGVGQIAAFEDLDETGQPRTRLDLESVTTSQGSIPLPPAEWTGLAGLIALGALHVAQRAAAPGSAAAVSG